MKMKLKSKAFVIIAIVLYLRLAYASDQEKAPIGSKEVSSADQKKGNNAKPETEVDIHPNGYDFGEGYGFGGSFWHGWKGGEEGGGDGFKAGFSHGGVYGTGKHCYFGCCSESFGYSHGGGGYYTCTCCTTAAEAKAHKENAQTKA